MRKPGIRDVAAQAGVSRATVDRVLNRRGGVAPDKERAVLRSAQALQLDRNLGERPRQLLRVGVLVKAPGNPFYSALRAGFEAANRRFAGSAIMAYLHTVDMLDPPHVQRRMRQAAAEYDALVVVAPDDAASRRELRAAAQRLPVIAIATDLPSDIPHHYVGPDNRRAGRLAGELMGRLLGARGGEVLVIGGLAAFHGHRDREQGFAEVLAADYPAVGPLRRVDSRDDEAMVGRGVARALARHPGIAGIYNISQGNAGMAQRFAPTPQSRPVIVCHDLTPVTMGLLRERRIDAVIDQDPALEAQRAMEIVLECYGRLAVGPERTPLPARIVLRESIV